MIIKKTIQDGITEFKECFGKDPDYILIRPSLRQLMKNETGSFALPEDIDGIRFEYSVHMPLHQVTIMTKDDKCVVKFVDLHDQ